MTKFDLASSCRVTTLRKLRSGLFHVKHWGDSDNWRGPYAMWWCVPEPINGCFT